MSFEFMLAIKKKQNTMNAKENTTAQPRSITSSADENKM